MGKGGQKVTVVPADASASQEKVALGPMKLDHLHTEELKKWAKAYGVNAEVERDSLLVALVSNLYEILTSDYSGTVIAAATACAKLTYLTNSKLLPYFRTHWPMES